ncbi:hypothetical protein [Adhaeribacter aquaticus]|uniref:hypothetical protein n=1 Tax=Adhaeribacter aquaticus TaxID=299567 RepID=UPI00040D32E6|nr:hypothetical protein [Adhaeribacter aquaticus]
MSLLQLGDFFKIRRNASEIKTEILLPFFKVWLEQHHHNPGVAAKKKLFLDLNTGAGYDKEGNPAAVLQLFDTLKAGQIAADQVQVFLHDPNKNNLVKIKANLEEAAEDNPLADALAYLDEEASQADLLELLNKQHPALVCMDPFSSGYSQKLLAGLEPDKWAADFFFIFSPTKLKATLLANEGEKEDQYFLTSRISASKTAFKSEKSIKRREQLLITKLEAIFSDLNYHTLSFKINHPDKNQADYYLLFASQAKPVYLAFKERLQQYSDLQEDEVPLMGANLQDVAPTIPGFFKQINKYCLENLVEELAQSKSRFHYKTIQEVYEEHGAGTPYSKKNYSTAFKMLKELGRINLVDQNNKQVKVITDNVFVFYKLHGSNKDGLPGSQTNLF